MPMRAYKGPRLRAKLGRWGRTQLTRPKKLRTCGTVVGLLKFAMPEMESGCGRILVWLMMRPRISAVCAKSCSSEYLKRILRRLKRWRTSLHVSKASSTVCPITMRSSR